MKPLQLSMTAFGPFPGNERIDFTRLGKNPLFLINGATGSGKTTILDALCFALYGKTTGDERDGAQMRCDLAPADTLTEVMLEFELAGQRYRIRRLPEQLRPKSRGEGTTSQSPEAQLYELLSDGSEKLLVSSKVTEATREIEELTGLSVDQFRQVMVLPQGKFRQLLLAESAEREKIFSQLFQTRIYKRLEESLKARSAAIRRERDDLLKRQQGILDGAEIGSKDELDLELQQIVPQIEQAFAMKKAQEEKFLAANNALQQAQTVKEEFARLAKVETELGQLLQQQVQIAAQRQRLEQAEQAEKLQAVFTDRQRCEGEWQQALVAAAEAQSEQKKTAAELLKTEQQLKDSGLLQTELDSSRQKAAQLGDFRERAERLRELHNRLAAAEQKVIGADLYLQYKLLTDRSLLCQELARLERDCQKQEALLNEKKEQGTQLKGQLQRAEERAKTLEKDWHLGQAAILAAELQESEPCPVCGSTEHPAPAISEQQLPTQQQVQEARDEVLRAQESLLNARELYAVEKNRLREFYAELERQRNSTSVADNSAAEIERQLKSLKGQAEQRKIQLPAWKQVLEFDAEILQAELEKSKDAALTARTQAETAVNELPEQYRQSGALEQAATELEKKIERLELQIRVTAENHQKALGLARTADGAYEAALRQRQKTVSAREHAITIFLSALQQSPFADEADFQSALIEEQDRQAVTRQIEEYESACQRLSGAKQQLTGALQGKAAPDVADIERQLKIAEEEKNIAVNGWQQLDKRFSLLRATQEKLAQMAEQQCELERQYAIVGTLSDVANGQTGNKISLQRFVLSVLLDDVLIEASRRLSLMSKGRYQLLRKEDRAKGNKASGLELEVEDAYSGKVRSVATLSGGESFMAALSLALGLSDVVQAYAGGIRLDTLFIDEGFGSLDPESLDLAVRALIDLQSTGRMVGVISHVTELKEQLPLRIDVITDRFGSKTRLVTV